MILQANMSSLLGLAMKDYVGRVMSDKIQKHSLSVRTASFQEPYGNSVVRESLRDFGIVFRQTPT